MAYLTTIENVFDAWATAMSETAFGENVYFERPDDQMKLPSACMFPLPSNELGYDLDNAASGVDLALQIDVFVRATAKLSEAYALHELSHNAMTAMGFRAATPTIEMPQSGYKRLITRYARVIGYGEPIANTTED